MRQPLFLKPSDESREASRLRMHNYITARQMRGVTPIIERKGHTRINKMGHVEHVKPRIIGEECHGFRQLPGASPKRRNPRSNGRKLEWNRWANIAFLARYGETQAELLIKQLRRS